VDGLYRVKRGDTLHGIAFKYGLDYRSIASWNSIRSPYTIFPDQVLRLQPPPRSSAGVTTKAAPPPSATTRSVEAKPASPPPQTRLPATASQTPQAASDATKWIWPTNGRLLRTFKQGDPLRNGVDIAGTAGQEVRASASGQVVYSGNGLIGYGELIIVKHNERMLSAYAHNRSRQVAEGDTVKQGQKIAEMGRNERDEQILHFEIRLDGEPVNPLNYLPNR
jgi:lipoprotein NlpD